MSCHTLLACRVSAERSAVNLMGIPLYVICCFSLAAFYIFSLYLIFDSLINMCLGVFLFGFILYGTVCASWTWLTISFPIVVLICISLMISDVEHPLMCWQSVYLWRNVYLVVWTIFKVFIEFVAILLLFYVLVFWPWGMWDLSSLIRNWTRTPSIGRRSLTHWTAR